MKVAHPCSRLRSFEIREGDRTVQCRLLFGGQMPAEAKKAIRDVVEDYFKKEATGEFGSDGKIDRAVLVSYDTLEFTDQGSFHPPKYRTVIRWDFWPTEKLEDRDFFPEEKLTRVDVKESSDGESGLFELWFVYGPKSEERLRRIIDLQKTEEALMLLRIYNIPDPVEA